MGELGSHLTQCGLGRHIYTAIPNGILIHPLASSRLTTIPVLIWTVINWTVITNPNPTPNPNLNTNNNNNNNTNSKPNTNPNPKSNPKRNRSPNPLLTVQISSIQISLGNFTVQILTVQISYGYPCILPLIRGQFVTNNTKFAPTLYWIIIR